MVIAAKAARLLLRLGLRLLLPLCPSPRRSTDPTTTPRTSQAGWDLEPICDEFLRGVIEAGEKDVAVRLLKARETIFRRWAGEDGQGMVRAVQAEHRNWSSWHLERVLCVSDGECPGEEELS